MNAYIFLLLVSLSCAKMTVRYGELDPGEYTECNISSNGVRYEYKRSEGREIPGLWFGLIEYRCEGVIGRLISVPTCKPCGWWCNYNQYIPGCANKNTIITLGCITGILTTIIGLLMLQYCYKRYYQTCLNKYMEIKANTKSQRRCKKAKKMKKMGFDIPKAVEEVPLQGMLPEAMERKVREKHIARLTKAGVISTRNGDKSKEQLQHHSQEDITNDPDQDVLNDMARCIDEMATKIKSKKTSSKVCDLGDEVPKPAKRTSQNPKKAALLGLLLASQGMKVEACDNTLFLHSNGKICHENVCQDINTYTLSMVLGQTICFKDVDNHELKMTLSETYHKTRYMSKYLTSDYDLHTESYWNCEWRGNCNAKECIPGFKYHAFHNKSRVEGYGCQTATLNCDTYCTSETKCVYYHWWLEQKGEVYPVMFKTSQIWEVRLKVSYKGVEKAITLNTNNPSSNVIGLLRYDDMKLPIVATSVMTNMADPPQTIIVANNQAYGMKSSELNFPENDIVGEHQIALDNATEVYNQMHVDCYIKNCAARCTSPEPTMRRFKRTLMGKRELGTNFTRIEGGQITEIKTHSFGSLTLAIGNLNLLNLEVATSYCRVAVKMTYECTACDVMPYAVLTAYEIKEPGIMLFESNCTFENNYVSCNPDMYKLTLIKHEDNCLIYIPTTNQTLSIHFENLFLGKLDPFIRMSSMESFSDSVGNIARSPDFWKSTLGSIGTMMGVGMALTTLVKIVRIIAMRKEAKEIETA